MKKLNKLDKAYNLLREYNGENPFILNLKRNVYIYNHTLSEFQIDFILNNHNFIPISVNKIVKIADWYGDKMKSEWDTDFTPKVLRVISYLGETTTSYCCIVQYRQSIQPITLFIPKSAVLTNFLIPNYEEINVDFERYNRLAAEKDPNRRIKPHQEDAVKFLLSRKKCILADDMGLGKTLSLSVSAIEGNFDRVLIICPASLKTNWRNELLYYVADKDISIIESFNNKTKAELEEFLGYKQQKSNLSREELLSEAMSVGKWCDNRFVIVNYDILDEFYEIPRTASKVNIDLARQNSPLLRFIENKKSLIIIDEAHRLSNNTSNRYKIIKDLVKRGKPDSIYLATGTPVTNNPQNLFWLLQFLDDPIKDNWDFYSKRYCGAMKIPAKGEKAKWESIYLKNKGKTNWFQLSPYEKAELKTYIQSHARLITIATGATNLEELKERISHIYLRRIKEDMGNLPSKICHELYYELNAMQRAEYERLWDDYEREKKSEDPDKELNKDLLEGAIYRNYLSKEMLPYTEKICDELIAKNEKVVIACCFDEELYSLKDYYGDKCVIYNGKMNSKQKDAAVKEFMENPDIMVFIGNIIAAGVGITLISSHNLIFNDMSYVPGDNFQMQDRIHRIGQTHDVDIYYQIFKDTQYDKMWNTVLKKAMTIDAIIKKEDDK